MSRGKDQAGFRLLGDFADEHDAIGDFELRIALVVLFFQAEDGIRDRNVTGVQTCALPISDYEPAVHWATTLYWWNQRHHQSIDDLWAATEGRWGAAWDLPAKCRGTGAGVSAVSLDRKSVVSGKSVGVGGGVSGEVNEV